MSRNGASEKAKIMKKSTNLKYQILVDVMEKFNQNIFSRMILKYSEAIGY